MFIQWKKAMERGSPERNFTGTDVGRRRRPSMWGRASGKHDLMRCKCWRERGKDVWRLEGTTAGEGSNKDGRLEGMMAR
jgi:hypothetical protein